MSTTKQIRALKDSSLLAAAKEVQGYLTNGVHLYPEIRAEYRSTLDKLNSEIARREI